MAVLEIKNLKSGELHHIPASGATLGREGAKAEIQIRDPGVSKRHARIYEKGGTWYLVDMGSSNGTFMQGERLTGPATLEAGAIFGMSRHKFEVMGVVPEGGSLVDGAPASAAGDSLYSEAGYAEAGYASADADLEPPGPPLPELSPAPPPAPVAPHVAPEPSYSAASAASPAATAPPELAAPAYAATPPPRTASRPGNVAGTAAGSPDAKKGARDVLVAVPKAIAFYLAAVPLLAVNPLGTVRKSIEEQKHPALNAGELISYALPANLFAVLLVSLATLIGQLVNGALSIGALLPIVPLVIAVVMSVVLGFLWHPVLGWLIRALKGESDERSRSNYFLMVQTARVLLAIPQAIGVLLALANVPFLNVIPPVLFTGSSLLLLLVTVKWLKFFDVMKPVQTVVLVLGLLGAAGSAWGIVSALLDSIDRVTSGSSASVDVGDVQAAAAEAAKQAEALQAELKAKLEAGASEEEIKAVKARIDAANAAVATAASAAATAAASTNAEAQGADGKEGGKVEVPEVPDVEVQATSDAPPALSYGEFASKVDKVERIIGGNPTVLKKDKAALQLYSAYHRARHEVEQAYQAQTEKNPSLRAVHERLRDAEIYERAANTIDELHKKLTSK